MQRELRFWSLLGLTGLTVKGSVSVETVVLCLLGSDTLQFLMRRPTSQSGLQKSPQLRQ